MFIKFKKLKESAIVPTRGSKSAAGYDLYACLDNGLMIPPHTTVPVGTGLAMEIQEGYFGAIVARSGIATKRGLRPANCIGVIDSDYRGEFIVALHNDTDVAQVIEKNERIAQLVIMQQFSVDFIETDKLSETERNTGGFGSSGRN